MAQEGKTQPVKHKGTNILVVDNDAGVRDLLTFMLSDEGYSVTAVADASEAVREASAHKFHAAVLDVYLPDSQDVELLKQLKEVNPSTACIIITGHASLQSSISAMREGAAGYLVKPLDLGQVVRTVQEALDKQRLRSENDRLLVETKAREEFLAALSRVVRAINSSLELEEVLSLLCREVVGAPEVDAAAIYIFDAPALTLRLRASSGIERSGIERIDLDDLSDFVGYSFWKGEPVLMNRDRNRVLRTDSKVRLKIPATYLKQGFASFVAMPLIRNERGLGILLLLSREPGRFIPEELDRARMLADHAAIAVKNAMLFEREKQRSQQLKLAIQEAHHRIKNNLQTVSVLLSLQMNDCTEPQARQALEGSMERIHAISLVHDLLSRDSDVRMINTQELLDKLITVVATATSGPNRQVSVNVDSQKVLISSRRATALALIAHELVANAIEHGVAGKDDGRIDVTLRKEGSAIAFSVRDNGRGLPQGFESHRDGRIGLNVVRTLVERDLSGRIEFAQCEPGLLAAVYFDDAGVAGDD